MTAYSAGSYRAERKPSWCKGCSYYGVLMALTEVLAAHGVAPHEVSVISGIGCSSRMPLFLNTYGCHTLHGRALPVAIGSRLARPDIPVVVVAGDGDFFSIGIGHFVHAARKNFNMTVICLDNRMYAMTKNQASPTSAEGYRGSLTPYGKLSVPLNVLEFALACDATFVSRSFAGSQEHMQSVFSRAFEHKGFAFVEVIAPCRTFERQVTLASLAPRCVDIGQHGHDPSDKETALTATVDIADTDSGKEREIPIGVFYECSKPTFESKVAATAFAPSLTPDVSSFFTEFSP